MNTEILGAICLAAFIIAAVIAIAKQMKSVAKNQTCPSCGRKFENCYVTSSGICPNCMNESLNNYSKA